MPSSPNEIMLLPPTNWSTHSLSSEKLAPLQKFPSSHLKTTIERGALEKTEADMKTEANMLRAFMEAFPYCEEVPGKHEHQEKSLEVAPFAKEGKHVEKESRPHNPFLQYAQCALREVLAKLPLPEAEIPKLDQALLVVVICWVLFFAMGALSVATPILFLCTGVLLLGRLQKYAKQEEPTVVSLEYVQMTDFLKA